jgi:hypothetical protein
MTISLLPVISGEIQQKLSNETKKLELNLFSKMHKSMKPQNNFITNFLHTKGKKDTDINSPVSALGVIDLTQEHEKKVQTSNEIQIRSINLSNKSSMINDLKNCSRLLSNDELNKVINCLMLEKSNNVNFTSADLNSIQFLAQMNPLLYSQINNHFLTFIQNSKNVKKINVKYPIEDEELYKNPYLYNLGKEFFFVRIFY